MHIPRSLCVLQSARAREFTLERGSESHARAEVERPSSVKIMYPVLFHKFTVRSSEENHARAELHCLHVHSSGESHTRAWTLFSASFKKCFLMHSCILIPF